MFFIERWVLSAVFLFLAYEYIDTLLLMRLFSASNHLLPAAMVARDHGLSDGVHFEDYARYTMLAVSNGACGLLLLISRKPSRYPTRRRRSSCRWRRRSVTCFSTITCACPPG